MKNILHKISHWLHKNPKLQSYVVTFLAGLAAEFALFLTDPNNFVLLSKGVLAGMIIRVLVAILRDNIKSSIPIILEDQQQEEIPKQ